MAIEKRDHPKIRYYRFNPLPDTFGYRCWKSEPADLVENLGLPPGLVEFPESEAERVMSELSEKGITVVLDVYRDDDGNLVQPDEDRLKEESEMDY